MSLCFENTKNIKIRDKKESSGTLVSRDFKSQAT